jgi:S1-C subfamily serine protease
MKKFSIGLLVGILLMFSVNAFAAVMLNEIPFVLYIDDVKVEKPLYADANGTTYAPLWEISEKFGIDAKLKGNDIYMTTPKTDTEAIAEKCKDSCVMVYAYTKTHQKQGSGFVYNGYVITAKHVVEGATRIDVYTDDELYGTRGVVHYKHPTLDVAVIKANTKKPSVVLGDSDKLTEGQKLISITSPRGNQNIIDECLFSGIAKYDKGVYFSISESEMDSGSSGGAIFGLGGETVALNMQGQKGINQAIPINEIKPILEALK